MAATSASSGDDPHSQDPVIQALRHTAAKVPAYARILAEHGVSPDDIRSLADFRRRVPVVDKHATFGRFTLPELCVDGHLYDVAAAYTSSGYSGEFSFGLETAAEAAHLAARVDRLLGWLLGSDTRRTLLINALPAGVRVPNTLALTIDTGPRAEAVVAAVRALGPSCEQILIVAEHPFLKLAVETGESAGLDWKSRTVFPITGAEVLPENFRGYVGAILGHDPQAPQRGRIIISAGISEISLSLGQETIGCMRLRQAIHKDAALRAAVFGDCPFAPTLVQYDPGGYFLETIADENGRPRLVVTTLDLSRKIPLIRYATGDWAGVFSANELHRKLPPGFGDRDSILEYPLPVLAIWGRGRGVRVGDREIFPEQVKELLYADYALARHMTGNFRMAEEGGRLRVRAQLKKDVAGPADAAREFVRRIEKETAVPSEVSLVPYEAMAEGMELSYQRKFSYLTRGFSG